jgi:hypothetical protein
MHKNKLLGGQFVMVPWNNTRNDLCMTFANVQGNLQLHISSSTSDLNSVLVAHINLARVGG